MTFPIPAKALQAHIAILGKTGSGKTVAAKGMVEGLLDAGSRACAIDPTGVWYGLRLTESGKRAAYPVVIFGGPHGDVALSANHGEAIAEIIGTSSTSAVIDTSLMRVSERTRFFADFADALVRKNKGPLHLVIDEAHLFMPQGKVADPQSGLMLHAANNLVSLGRSRGLRITIISQRPAKVHKDSLTQIETLIAMRLIAPQDRNAVEAWIKDNADDAKGAEIIGSLAMLKTGEAWLWAPELGVLDRIKFPKNRTFDSSRAPEGSDSGPSLTPIDLASVNERLATIEAETKVNDPKTLKAEIARLKSEAAKAAKAQPSADAAAIKAAHDEGFRQGEAETAPIWFRRGAEAVVEAMKDSVSKFTLGAFLTEKLAVWKHIGALPAVPSKPAPVVQRAQITRPVRTTATRSNGHLPPGERAVLIAAAQFDGIEREQLTILTGYKRSSRDAYIQRLREKGLVELQGSQIIATADGAAALPSDYEPLPTGVDLQAYWLARLPEGERRILGIFIDNYPKFVARTTLDDLTGYARSSRDAYLQRMKAKRLWEGDGSSVRASEALFE